MRRPLLLDLFCGAGGAAMGYHRAGFDVVGIDLAPQPHYPFPFIQGDALAPPVRLEDFDAIHASPPCQSYSSLNRVNRSRGHASRKPELVGAIRRMLSRSGPPWVIENVEGSDTLTTVRLCGSSFGLGVRRHRNFECSVLLMGSPACDHDGHEFVGVYSNHPGRDRPHPDGFRRRPRAESLEEAQEAMGMPWADWHGVKEAIPPAYTEWIGTQLLAYVKAAA